MSKDLRVLLVEDSDDDALLIQRELRLGGYNITCKRVDTAAAMEEALAEPWDIAISDYVMPQFNGLAALKMAREKGLDIPFIIVSGQIGEETAVAAMKAGAHDYVMKDRLARLVPAVERELREAEVRAARRRADAALRESEEQLRQLAKDLEIRVQARTADLKTANAELQRQMIERRRLENELLEIAERERKRIGIDLHDELGQHLNGIALMLKGLELKLQNKKLPESGDAAKIQGLVFNTINQAKNVARGLAQEDLKAKDLATMLEEFAEQTENLFPLSCNLSISGSVPNLPEATVKQLYKIAQEAVTNAVKHAKATEIQIELKRTGDELKLTIQNNGLPFPTNRFQTPGMGLKIMQYRASVIGGSFDVHPAPVETPGAIACCIFPTVGPQNGSEPDSKT